MNAEERFNKAVAEYGDNVAINVDFREMMISTIRTAEREAMERCIKGIDHWGREEQRTTKDELHALHLVSVIRDFIEELEKQ